LLLGALWRLALEGPAEIVMRQPHSSAETSQIRPEPDLRLGQRTIHPAAGP